MVCFCKEAAEAYTLPAAEYEQEVEIKMLLFLNEYEL